MGDTLIPNGTSVNRKRFTNDAKVLPFGSMVVAKLPKEPTELGKRIRLALEEEGRSQNSAAEAAGFKGGYLSRLIYGSRGGTSMNPEHMRRLAKVLHVNFEWLVVGEGPMRREGRGTNAAEEAITSARAHGCREDALQSAWENNKDACPPLTFIEWIVAIDVEARRLDRAGVPRPEKVLEKQAATRRVKNKIKRNAEANNGGKLDDAAPDVALTVVRRPA